MGAQTHPKPKMWMLDGKDYVKDFKDGSIFERRRLRHLMPRPTTTTSTGKAGPPRPLIASSFCNSICKTHAFSWNDQLSKDQEGITEPSVSSRWNPTPEQLKALQEMYQRGVRTPSAEEIQLIAAKLRHFGRIEGKNVFYWFQNHKARERQKRRRQPDTFPEKKTRDIESLEAKETSLGWKCLETEQNKKLFTSSNCSLAPKGFVSMNETAVTESIANGWIHLDEKQQRQTSHRRAAKSEAFLMDLSCMNPSYFNQLNTINAPSTSEETSGTAEQKKSTSLSFKIFSANQDNKDEDLRKVQNGYCSRENQILQLFPLRDNDSSPSSTNKIGEEDEVNTTLNGNFNPNHFYEFL